MVKTRKAIESLYTDVCTITEHKKIKKENLSTGFQDVVVLENQPCRVSFKTVNSASQGDVAATIVQIVKVFLAPEIQVKPGSKITITRNNVVTEYKCSGQPALYDTHQEVVLELFKGWA